MELRTSKKLRQNSALKKKMNERKVKTKKRRKMNAQRWIYYNN